MEQNFCSEPIRIYRVIRETAWTGSEYWRIFEVHLRIHDVLSLLISYWENVGISCFQVRYTPLAVVVEAD